MFVSTNAIGNSPFSDEVVFAAAALPVQPNPPYKVNSESTTTSISVQWDMVPDSYIPTDGYLLYQDGGNDGNYSLVFNGQGEPGMLKYLATGLVPGQAYRFYVVALNFNG